MVPRWFQCDTGATANCLLDSCPLFPDPSNTPNSLTYLLICSPFWRHDGSRDPGRSGSANKDVQSTDISIPPSLPRSHRTHMAHTSASRGPLRLVSLFESIPICEAVAWPIKPGGKTGHLDRGGRGIQTVFALHVSARHDALSLALRSFPQGYCSMKERNLQENEGWSLAAHSQRPLTPAI